MIGSFGFGFLGPCGMAPRAVPTPRIVVHTYALNLSDSVGLSEGAPKVPTLTKVDSVSLTDVEKAQPGLVRPDTVAFSEADAFQFHASHPESLGITDAFGVAASFSKSDALAFTEGDVFHATIVRSDPLEISEAHAVQARITRPEPLTLADAVATRMYRSTTAMMEGWTKNLALLFDNCLALAAWRVLDIALLVGLPVRTVWLWNARFSAHPIQWLGAGWVLALVWVRNLFRFYGRVAKSNFPFLDCALAPLGLPLFVALLCRSWFQHRIRKRVSWKGREYAA